MIYKATMINGKREASMWLVGKRFDGRLTRHQEYGAHLELQRRTKADVFACSWIKERKANGELETICAGNCY